MKKLKALGLALLLVFVVAAAPIAIAVVGAFLGLAIPVGILYLIIRMLQSEDEPQGSDPPEED